MAGLAFSYCVTASAGDDFDELAFLRTALHELYHTIGLGKQGVILAATHVSAGVEVRAPLPDDDITGQYRFTAVTLYA